MINLSIIILSYNTKELLKRCLESVVKGISGIGCVEVIVIDNQSTDGSGEYLKTQMLKLKTESQNLKLKIILNKENLGFAKGNNQGVKKAGGKYIMFLNSDTVVNNKAMSLLIDFLEKNPEIAAASPLILNQDGSIQKDPCYLQFPTPIFTFFYYNSILKKIAENFFPNLIYSTKNFSTPNKISQLSGAALMIKKEIFEKVGGFNEGYLHFFEDVDLSFRLKKKGYKLYLAPEAKIVHFGGKSLEAKVKKEGIESYYLLNFKSLFKFSENNYSWLKSIQIKLVVIFCLFFKLRLKLIFRLVFSQQ